MEGFWVWGSRIDGVGGEVGSWLGFYGVEGMWGGFQGVDEGSRDGGGWGVGVGFLGAIWPEAM